MHEGVVAASTPTSIARMARFHMAGETIAGMAPCARSTAPSSAAAASATWGGWEWVGG